MSTTPGRRRPAIAANSGPGDLRCRWAAAIGHHWPDAHGTVLVSRLSAYTPQQLDRARHPYELGPSDHVYLFIDDAVHGIGSRACGVDVLPGTRCGRATEFGMFR